MDFECLVSPYLKELFSYCLYLTGSKWDGEDLYQETLLKTYVYFSNIDNVQGLKALMFKVAKNIWIDDYRKRRSRVTVSGAIYSPPCRDTDYAEIRGQLEEMAERLPDRYMEMILLTDLMDYSMQEIAETTGSTVPAVKCAIHRARKLLRNGEQHKRKSKKTEVDIEMWTKMIVYGRPVTRNPWNRELSTVS